MKLYGAPATASGRAAGFVRGFRAVYLGLFFNCVIMATVNLAAAKIGASERCEP